MATTTDGREASPVTTPDPRPRRRRRVITWTAIAVVAVIAAIAAYWALARSGTVPRTAAGDHHQHPAPGIGIVVGVGGTERVVRN